MGSMTQPTMTDVTSTSNTSGSNSNKSTQTPYQQAWYNQMLGQANNLYQTGLPQYYQGATVSGLTPAQLEAQNLASNWVTGGAQDQMNTMMGNYNDMMSGRVNTGAGSPYGDMMDVYKQQAMDSAQDVMGGLRSSQVMSGQQGGSSRGDILNNRVIDEANQQVANAGAQMYNNAYNQAQATRNNALGQYGNIMNMPLSMSSQLYNQVGLPQQQLNQAIMNDARSRYDHNSMLPLRNLEYFRNMISGNMGGSTSSSGSSSSSTTSTSPVQGPSQMDTLKDIVGLGTSIAPFFMRPSDERIKENVVPDGKYKDYNVYKFNYIGDTRTRRGVMAQEVEKVNPGAVLEIDGIKHVNYGAL